MEVSRVSPISLCISRYCSWPSLPSFLVRSSSIPGIFPLGSSFPFFEQLPDRGRRRSERNSRYERRKEGTNYALVKKKMAVGKYRLESEGGKKLYFPFFPRKRYDWKFSFLEIITLRNNRSLILRNDETEFSLDFLVRANFLSARKLRSSYRLPRSKMERHSQLRWSKSWSE